MEVRVGTMRARMAGTEVQTEAAVLRLEELLVRAGTVRARRIEIQVRQGAMRGRKTEA